MVFKYKDDMTEQPPSVKYSHSKKLRKKLWLIYELLIMRKTQEKIILYARFCHMHNVKKFKMLTVYLTMMFSLQPAPAHLLSHG